ncbi:MAG: hypothetical protein H0W83_06545 [Planctomycetes bacterium]|nr:hypothetical protein [Planctomycetota bacterium]
MPTSAIVARLLVAGTALGMVAQAADQGAATPPAPGVVCHVSVMSNQVEDVSSMEAWKKSFIKDGMTDEQKAIAVWTTVVKFRHQEPPPIEFLSGDGDDVHDPIKTFNVYGYGMCCCASSNISSLARYAGLKARGWGINGHSVPEVFFDDAWHLFDASLICSFPKADGKIAGVEEIIAGVNAWYDQHTEFRAAPDKLYPYSKGNVWKTSGPDILAHTVAYNENGWLPAATHGWYSTMQEYNGTGGGADGKAFLYDYGYSQGYEVNIQLRPGERLTRNWSNHGLHVNQDLGGGPGCLTEKTGEGQLRYAPGFGDLTNTRVGNGTSTYEVPLASGAFRTGALVADNLECSSEVRNQDKPLPALHVKDTAKPGVLIIRMPSSYVYLGGTLTYAAKLGPDGAIAAAFSDNNGLDWKELPAASAGAANTVDLKPLIYRRYDYRLRFTLTGAGTGLDALTISHDIQNSQRALPALSAGVNTIHVAAGAQESTITLEGSTNPANKGKQLVFSDFHPVLAGIAENSLRLDAGQGTATFPVSTPGDLTRLRFGCNYRARDAKDAWDLQASFDGGKTFVTADRFTGPTGIGTSRYITFSKIPAGTREALVRFAGTQVNTTMISRFRIDADYQAPNAGFRPVQVTYTWQEDGQPKQDVHIAKAADETYTITCAAKPVMGAIALELAAP